MNKFNTADLCDDHSLVIVKPIFKSYGMHTHCFGKIKTVEAIEDNSYVKRLLQEDGSGCVMVIDGRGSEKCALVGDNLAALGAKNNWSGIIVNGCIRDSIEINNIGISIKAINLVPNKSEKKDIGKYGLDLNFAGAIFKENDFLYSDPDGIVISTTNIL
jgi:regulator of ribonuclease activity A